MIRRDAPVTVHRDAVVEAQAIMVLDDLASRLAGVIDAPVLLGGSAGRGEASIERRGDSAVWHSDVEAYVIAPRLRDRSRIRNAAPNTSGALGPTITVDWMTPARWRRLLPRNRFPNRHRLSLQMYDLAHAGRWLRGSLPTTVPRVIAIAPDEGLRLLLNRVVELSGSDVQASPERRVRWMAKLALAAHDARALFTGTYDPMLSGRLAAIRAQTDSSHRRMLAAAVEHLLGGAAPDEDELRSTALALARSEIKAALVRLTGWYNGDSERFARRFPRAISRRGLLRSHALGPFVGPMAENVVAAARLGRHDPLARRVLTARGHLLLLPWSASLAMLDLVDPAAGRTRRARAAAVLSAVSASLGEQDSLDGIVDAWKRLV